MGVVASSGLMSMMNLATVCWAGDSLGFTCVSRSVLAGLPRSARSMSTASVEFTHQLMKLAAASGFLVLLDADHSMLALYHALRSVALPVWLGSRSNFIAVPPAAAPMASSWLVLESARPA